MPAKDKLSSTEYLKTGKPNWGDRKAGKARRVVSTFEMDIYGKILIMACEQLN